MIVDHSILRNCGIFDLVIVGAGPAGLTLAAECGRRGLRILLVEAGGLKEMVNSRAAFAGEIASPGIHPSLDLYRVRALGGTSRIWGGRCIPLDPIDFATREWIPWSGWPISYD